MFGSYSLSSMFSPIHIFLDFVVLFSLVVHEFAHAITADVLGDDTPRANGRLTLNPMAHLDLLGIIMIVMVGIGWARPVPISSSQFKRPRLGMILSVAAGPMSNLLIAIVAFIILAGTNPYALQTGSSVLVNIGVVNCALFLLNIIPIPPLDGSQIVRNLLPYRAAMSYSRLDPYGPFILLFLFIIPTFYWNVFMPLVSSFSGWVMSWFM